MSGGFISHMIHSNRANRKLQIANSKHYRFLRRKLVGSQPYKVVKKAAHFKSYTPAEWDAESKRIRREIIENEVRITVYAAVIILMGIAAWYTVF